MLIDRFVLFLGGCFSSCFHNCEREGRGEKERKGWGERENVNTHLSCMYVCLQRSEANAGNLAPLSLTLVF